MPRGSHPARPMRFRPTSKLSTEQADGTVTEAQTSWPQAWVRQGAPLRAKPTKDVIQRPTELKIAVCHVAAPHASTQEQLLASPGPTLCLQHPRQRGIIKSRDQGTRDTLLQNPAEHDGERLIETRIPSHIAKQLKSAVIAAFRQADATGQNDFSIQQHTRTGGDAVQQIQPMSIGDLAVSYTHLTLPTILRV